MNKKLVKSYTLSESAVKIIEAFSKQTGNSLSQEVEYLILRGVENTKISEHLTDRVTQYVQKLIDQDHKNTDRLISVLIGQTRILGKIFGVSITAAVRSGSISQDDLEEIYASGIKKAMLTLKSNNSGEKEYA
jgi:sorbitol-specific phosphotransferase system component IIBC